MTVQAVPRGGRTRALRPRLSMDRGRDLCVCVFVVCLFVWKGPRPRRPGQLVSLTTPRGHRSYNQGLISADRSNKATLLLTIPRCLLSRLQRISCAQLSKLISVDRARGLTARPVATLTVQA